MVPASGVDPASHGYGPCQECRSCLLACYRCLMQLHRVIDFPALCGELALLGWFILRTFVEGRLRCLDRDSNSEAREGGRV